jgi:hypothetical protein
MRALSQIQFKKGAAVASLEDVMVRYPLPPKKGAKKEEKKKKDEPPPEPKIPETLSIAKAHAMAHSWQNAATIQSKHSVGTLTTAKYQERVSVFDRMNTKAQEHAALHPQQSYFGATPDPQKDPYDRRHVKQLNDISFEGESGEEGEGNEIFENVRNVQRLP